MQIGLDRGNQIDPVQQITRLVKTVWLKAGDSVMMEQRNDGVVGVGDGGGGFSQLIRQSFSTVFSARFVSGKEMDRELRAATDPVLNGDGCAMQFDDALHNRKPKSCTSRLATIATPETAKNKIPFLL